MAVIYRDLSELDWVFVEHSSSMIVIECDGKSNYGSLKQIHENRVSLKIFPTEFSQVIHFLGVCACFRIESSSI